MNSFAQSIRRSPLWIVFIICAGLLMKLIVRGLDIGPLHTDVVIMRAWFHEVGIGGYVDRYLDVNQRHLLDGPL
jgi:hypothetical protein